MLLFFSSLFQICINDKNLPKVYIDYIEKEHSHFFSIGEKNHAFLSFLSLDKTVNHTIYISGVKFRNSHLYIPFSTFRIYSANTYYLLLWVLPKNLCTTNFIIGTDLTISAVLNISNTTKNTCLFLKNNVLGVSLKPNVTNLSIKRFSNGSDNSYIFFLIEPALNGIFSLAFQYSKYEEYTNDSCEFQPSFHFTGSEFKNDSIEYRKNYEYDYNCESQKRKFVWKYIYLIPIGLIVLSIVGCILKANDCRHAEKFKCFVRILKTIWKILTCSLCCNLYDD